MLQRKDAISLVSDTVYKTVKDSFLHEENIKIILINDVVAPPHCEEKYDFLPVLYSTLNERYLRNKEGFNASYFDLFVQRYWNLPEISSRGQQFVIGKRDVLLVRS